MNCQKLKIDKIELKNNLLLAPLAGYSDFALREICLQCGAGLCFTEMVSAKGLLYNNKNTEMLLRLAPSELHSVKAVQIFGNSPEIMRNAAESEALKDFDIVDINMGCPVPKVYNNKEGSALLENISLAEKIVAEVKKSGKIVTVKMRTGLFENKPTCVELSKAVECAGASMVTLHARSRERYYNGEPNYELLEKTVSAVKIPVIGNGGIIDEQSADRMMETGVKGIMLARGGILNPQLFSILLHKPLEEKSKLILRHINLIRGTMPDKYASSYLRKQLSAYLNGNKNARSVRLKIFKAESLDELEKIIIEAYN